MLITTCTHCKAKFRVTPQQLNARQGQVRCGRCHAVFSGFESLERFPDDDTGARLLAAREALESAAQEPAPSFIETLSEDDLPEIEMVTDVPSVPLPVELGAAPSTPFSPARAPAPASAQEFSLETAPRKPLSRAWSFGVVLLAIILAGELVFAFRGPLAQRYPALRPPLESVCAQVQCTVPWAREDGLLKLEESELLEVPGKPNEIALGARIRNLASVAQEYPYLELTLTDLTGQAAARRVLRPTDYLGRPVVPGEVLAPGVEVAIQLRLETPRIKATGYELLLFYP
ncbi:MAG: zinc-ribbon and DUF3426 domain-containing protein [Usitatibacter sp.]